MSLIVSKINMLRSRPHLVTCRPYGMDLCDVFIYILLFKVGVGYCSRQNRILKRLICIKSFVMGSWYSDGIDYGAILC